jgi:hypothetical protein
MTAIRFFTDEDIYGAIAPALRRMGFDAVSTPEVNHLSASDHDQLAWAAAASRALVTFNVGDFAGQHAHWLQSSNHHWGIILSALRPIGELLRRLHHLATTLDAEAMRDRLEFLSDW